MSRNVLINLLRNPMKKMLITFAATTALWAALAGALVYTEQVYVLTKANVAAIEESFAGLYAEGYKYFMLYDKCKNSI